jgi:hypothetical protein
VCSLTYISRSCHCQAPAIGGRKENKARNVRGGGGSEERVLAERLEGEAAEEPCGGAVGVVRGAVVHVHGDEEDGDAGHGGAGDEPRRPPPVVGPRPDDDLLLVVAPRAVLVGRPHHQHLHVLLLLLLAAGLHGWMRRWMHGRRLSCDLIYGLDKMNMTFWD